MILLDTHAFLWFIAGSEKLSPIARGRIEGSEATLVSVASLWEMAIKLSLGKLELSSPFESLIPEQIRVNGFGILTIDLRHLFDVASLPYHHRDPFDRLLIAQCRVEGYPIVSKDSAFDRYSIERVW